ncbi:hypothetical protein GWL_07020 [Herbaspirillum sp. GW103]|nr:hypothetical protein GWL_07020 [Herbaspirillum sp. GW103]
MLVRKGSGVEFFCQFVVAVDQAQAWVLARSVGGPASLAGPRDSLQQSGRWGNGKCSGKEMIYYINATLMPVVTAFSQA